MNRMWSTIAIVSLVLLSADSAVGQSAGGLGGTGSMWATDNCIGPLERAWVREEAARNARYLSSVPNPRAGSAIAPYPFIPMGGTLYGDVIELNYVDLDPTSGILDWRCSEYTYNGHRGVDTYLRSFGEQSVGVPVFAALDGTVIFTHDGEPDMNTQALGQVSNLVVLDHGNGHHTSYFHLKNGSVSVSLGQFVPAGTQIGEVASSGNSSGPHLHFETEVNGVAVEPYAGACNAGAGNWANQPSFIETSYLWDFGFTHEDLRVIPGWPFKTPRDSQIATSDPFLFIWTQIANLPADSTYRMIFERPDGTIEWETPTWPLDNPDWRWGWIWFWFDIEAMHSITGTWHVEFFLNDEQLVRAPLEVRTERTADFNRPPAAIGVAPDPAAPTTNDVIFCRVLTENVFDDMDFDLVRYEYVWTVDDVEIRRVTSAAHSDAIPRQAAGSVVTCTVTPSDGQVPGVGDVMSITVAPVLLPGDMNCDGMVSVGDINGFVLALTDPAGYDKQFPGCSRDNADCNDDDQVSVGDINCFVALVTGG